MIAASHDWKDNIFADHATMFLTEITKTELSELRRTIEKNGTIPSYGIEYLN
jgi:hypothetical protein